MANRSKAQSGRRSKSHDSSRLDNLCAIVDVNRLGQSDPTMLQHDMESYRARWSGFGWHAVIVDGHDLPAILGAFEEAARTKHKPTVLLAKTFKGKGISFMQDQPNWHGKPIPQGAEMQKAIDELSQQLQPNGTAPVIPRPSALGCRPDDHAPPGPTLQGR